MENSSLGELFPALSLSGFSFSAQQRALLFAVTLLWYCVILVGNFGIIFIVALDRSMHEPMYIFLCNLCVNALYGTLGFYPKFLADLVRLVPVSYGACMLQGFVIHSATCGDFSILTLMAYDRYVAICRPLLYHVTMTRTRVWLLVLASWLVPLCAMFMNTATLLGRELCGFTIGRIYCVNWMVTSLTCAPSPGNAAVSYFNMLFYFAHFLFVLYSYLRLVRTCAASRESTRRFLRTCVPHLVSLCAFACSTLLDLLYMRFGSAHISTHLSNFFAIEFLLVPPVINPLIYGLKLSRIRRTVTGLCRRGSGAGRAARTEAEARGPEARRLQGPKGPKGPKARKA